MALDMERSPAALSHWGSIRATTRRLTDKVGTALPAIGDVRQRMRRVPGFHLLSSSLLRRILLTNMIGLAIMMGGILYSSQYHAWLIDAKRESLKTQGEIIAAAIASDARVEKGDIEIPPPRAGNPAPTNSYRDEGLAALELSIRPERVTPILRRLIQPTHNRARIYGRDGTLIVDSASLLQRGQISRPQPPNEKPRTKNFWTRLTQWIIDKDLAVYREIGAAKGTLYPEVRQALGGETTPMLLLNEKGEQIVSMAVPICRAGVVQGVLLLSTRPGDIDDILDEERSVIWTLGALALIATLLTSFLLARTVAEPMRRLSEAAEHVSRDITAHTKLPDYSDRRDEVGQMASAFRAMTAALYRRVEASESFAADVAHELKNPLTAARSTAESLAYARSDEQREELVRQIQNELKRLNRLINDVSNASRLDAELARQQMEPFDVTNVVSSVARIFRDILSESDRRIVVDIERASVASPYVIDGDEGRLGQVLTNLVDNALSFSPAAGRVTIRVRRIDGKVELAVEDEGPGIPEDRMHVIFDRFYTDRPATEATRGKNSGLGLSISREIVRSHGGEIWAETRKPGAEGGERPHGARFVVQLPAASMTQRGGGAGGWRH